MGGEEPIVVGELGPGDVLHGCGTHFLGPYLYLRCGPAQRRLVGTMSQWLGPTASPGPPCTPLHYTVPRDREMFSVLEIIFADMEAKANADIHSNQDR